MSTGVWTSVIQYRTYDKCDSSFVYKVIINELYTSTSYDIDIIVKKNLKVTLTYPMVSESQKYELVENDGSQIISSMSYTSETEAQFALLEICNNLTADTGDNAS